MDIPYPWTAAAMGTDIKVVVDPKHSDFAYYIGASLLTRTSKFVCSRCKEPSADRNM